MKIFSRHKLYPSQPTTSASILSSYMYLIGLSLIITLNCDYK